MNTLTTRIALALTFFSTLSASATSLRCDSPNVRIAGDFSSTYVRMGKSTISGNFTIMVRDNSGAVMTSQVNLINGSIQDDRELFFQATNYQQLQNVTLDLDLTSSSMSSVQINNDKISFFARCALVNSPQPSPRPYPNHTTH